MRLINVNKIADESKFNSFHGLVLFWCTFIIIFDGYDLVVYGTIVPALMKEWSLTPIELGTLGSYALFGMMCGAFIFGPLADKLGRKNVTMICVILFSLFTLLCGFANTVPKFGIYRFIAGLGLGGVMPNVVALMTEYSPRQFKSRMVALMFSGYCIGGVLAAALGIIMIQKMGWQSVFYISVIPLILLPLMYKSLPDSIGFYLAKNKKERAGQLLSKLNPSYVPQKNDQYELVIPEKTGITVLQLFKEGRALSTIMFWCAFFMCLLMIYGLNTWLPKLMEGAGYELGSSLMFLLVLNLGAIFGAVFGGWAADRWSGKKVLIAFFILASVSLSLLGFKANIFVVYTLVAIAGATTIGTQIIAYAYVSQYYPMKIRSTGIGWASGVGRFGAVGGPMLDGYLLTMNLPFQQNFLAFAVPGIIAAVAIGFVKEKRASSQEIEHNYEQDNVSI